MVHLIDTLHRRYEPLNAKCNHERCHDYLSYQKTIVVFRDEHSVIHPDQPHVVYQDDTCSYDQCGCNRIPNAHA